MKTTTREVAPDVELTELAAQQRARVTQNTITQEDVYHNRATGHTHRVNRSGVFWGYLFTGVLFWPIFGEWGHFVAAFVLTFITFPKGSGSSESVGVSFWTSVA